MAFLVFLVGNCVRLKAGLLLYALFVCIWRFFIFYHSHNFNNLVVSPPAKLMTWIASQCEVTAGVIMRIFCPGGVSSNMIESTLCDL